uniref:Uncharacterized protein n=1 Tax=Panagrolaimus superbus TaxID=310955 RepID=A0A914YV99_9BILA
MSEKEKKEQAIAMEDFDEEPNYLHGDSVMLDPTTPKKLLLSSSSYRQSYRDRNLEEPTESFFDGKENLSGIVHNNSTYCKSSNTLEHKSFQMSRLGCVGRQFAPDKAFFIEKVIKEVRELKCLVQNLNIDLPGIDNVIPELVNFITFFNAVKCILSLF